MAKPTNVEITNEHREALALACYEHERAIRPFASEDIITLEEFRIKCNSIRYRCDVLLVPNIHQRYVQIRGFDPREVRSAPTIRWLQ